MPQHTSVPQSLSVWQKWSALTDGSHTLAVLVTEKRSHARPLDAQSASCEQNSGQPNSVPHALPAEPKSQQVSSTPTVQSRLVSHGGAHAGEQTPAPPELLDPALPEQPPMTTIAPNKMHAPPRRLRAPIKPSLPPAAQASTNFLGNSPGERVRGIADNGVARDDAFR